jgi:hypothetical protein
MNKTGRHSETWSDGAFRLHVLEPAAGGKTPPNSNVFVFNRLSHHEVVVVRGFCDQGHSTGIRRKCERFRVSADRRDWRVACHYEVGKMKRTTLAAHALILLVVMVPNAFGAITPADGAPYHVRTTDPTLTALIQDGVRTSPTFRALVERLIASDVVVYLRCEHQIATHADGRLTFAASAGGLRYVVVRVRRMPSRTHLLALIGHELQHAVEIADTPAIVDGPSLAREYERRGYISRWASGGGIAFDTADAVHAGEKVLRELIGVSTD